MNEQVTQIFGAIIVVLAAIAVYQHSRGISEMPRWLLVVVIIFTYPLSIPAYIIGKLIKRGKQ